MKKIAVITGAILLIGIIIVKTSIPLKILKFVIERKTNLKIDRIYGNLSKIFMKNVKYADFIKIDSIAIKSNLLNLIKNLQIQKVSAHNINIRLKRGIKSSPFHFPFKVKEINLFNVNARVYEYGNLFINKGKASLNPEGSKFIVNAKNLKWEFKNFKGILENAKLDVQFLKDRWKIKIDTLISEFAGGKIFVKGVYYYGKSKYDIEIKNIALDKMMKEVHGKANGKIRVNYREKPMLKGEIFVKNLILKGKEIGKAKITFKMDTVSRKISILSKKLNLQKIFPQLEGMVNLKMNLCGINQKYDGNIVLSGRILNVKIEYLKTNFKIEKNFVYPEKLWLGRLKKPLKLTGYISKDTVNLIVSADSINLCNLYKNAKGIISGRIKIYGNIKKPILKGKAILNNIKLGTNKNERLELSFEIKDFKNLLGYIKIKGDSGELAKLRYSSLYADYNSREKKFSLIIKGEGISENMKGEIFKNMIKIDTMEIRTKRLHLKNEKEITVMANKEELKLKETQLLVNNFPLKVKGKYSKGDIVLYGKLRNFLLQKANPQIKGILDMDANLFGKIKDIHLILKGKVRNIEYKTQKFDSLFYIVEYDSGLFSLKSIKIFGKDISKLSGSVSLLENTLHLNCILKKIPLNILPVEKHLNVENGFLSTNLIIMGDYKRPEIYGDIEITADRILFRDVQTVLKNIYIKLVGSGNVLEIDSAQCFTEKGALKISGKIYQPDSVDITLSSSSLSLSGIDVKFQNAFNLRIKGPISNPEISGAINIISAIITADFGTQRALPAEIPLKLDLTVKADKTIRIINRWLDCDASADIKVKTLTDRPVVTGKIELEKGGKAYIPFIPREFEIVKGKFIFESSINIDPKIEILARTTIFSPDTDTIYLMIGGKFSAPLFSTYSVIKPRTFEEILTLLTLQMTPEELQNILQDETQLQQIGEKAFNAWLRYSVAKIKSLTAVEKALGLDALTLKEIKILEKPTAKIYIGKYITKDLYMGYSYDITSLSIEKSEIYTVYRLFDKGRFVVKRDENGEFTTAVEFKIRF